MGGALGAPPSTVLLLRPSLDDEAVRVLAAARLVALGRLAPRRHRVAAAGRLALAAAERVVHRVHRDAADVRTLAEPAAASRLADRHVLVIEVADLADRRQALDVDLANLARRHAHAGVVALARDQLHRGAGAARNLAALARLQLHVVNLRAERNVLQPQTVARQDVDLVARDERVADLDAVRLQDVALLAVRVREQRDARRAVRVVLDGRDLRRDVLLVALEVDHPVQALVAAAAPPGRQVALVVAAPGVVQVLRQRPVRLIRRDLVEGERRLAAHTGRGRVVFADRHGVLRSLQEVRKLLAVPQLHVRLFPVRAAADVLALALELAVRQRRADALHLRAEQRLDGFLDVDFVGVHRHLEYQRLAVLAEDRGLLGNERAPQHACQFHGGLLTQSLLQFFDRRTGQHDETAVDDVARTHAVAREHPHALDVAHRQRQRVFRLDVDEQRLPVDAEAPEHLDRRLRLDLRDAQRIDDGHFAVAQLLRQRGAQRAFLDLFRQLVFVAPRLGAEHRAALAPQRVSDLAETRAAGSLLPPRLLAAAADHRAGLGGVRAATVGRVGAHDRFVNQVGLDAPAEQLVAQVDRTDLLVV